MTKKEILTVMNIFHEKMFERIIEKVFDPKTPGASFWAAVEKFQKILNNLGYTYCPFDEDIKRPLVDIYRKVAAEKGIDVRPLISVGEKKDRERVSIVTSDMRWGAQGFDLRHRKMLGKDY